MGAFPAPSPVTCVRNHLFHIRLNLPRVIGVAASAGQVMVETRGLSKHYGNGIVAVDQLHMAVRAGATQPYASATHAVSVWPCT
jgi:hypothetical protein